MKIKEIKPKNRDYEFEADLENHPLGNQFMYRLHYVDYHRFGEGYGMGPNNVGRMDFHFKPFMLPQGMSREDAFKVLSYLTDYIEKRNHLTPCSYDSVAFLDKMLELDKLGFVKLNTSLDKHSNEVIDLFTVTGRLLLFKQSEYYQKYFEWYTENVTFEEVRDIYAKYDKEFDNIEEQNMVLELTKKVI